MVRRAGEGLALVDQEVQAVHRVDLPQPTNQYHAPRLTHQLNRRNQPTRALRTSTRLSTANCPQAASPTSGSMAPS